jgi:hypothetical protein
MGVIGLRNGAGADCGSGYIGKGEFRKFGLIFGASYWQACCALRGRGFS